MPLPSSPSSDLLRLTFYCTDPAHVIPVVKVDRMFIDCYYWALKMFNVTFMQMPTCKKIWSDYQRLEQQLKSWNWNRFQTGQEMLWRLSSEIFIWPAAALSIVSTRVSSEVWPLCALHITYQMRQHGPVLDGRQFSNWREILNSGSDGMSVRHNKAPNSSKYLQYLAQWDCSRKSVSR